MRKKVLGALCFCVQLFTETVGRGAEGLRGWWVCGGGRGWGGGGGAEALEASAREQLVFQILMVLNTKRPQQIPTAEVSDGK